jgi:hypothetical protein
MRHDTRTHGKEWGGGVQHDLLYCASVAYFSRPESGVISMTDDDFVRVVGDKGKGKKENRRQSN